MNHDSKIYVAGHTGLVGSAFLRKLQESGYRHIVTRVHCAVDLTTQSAVEQLFEQERPDCVILAAAKTGGIWANSHHPADFIYQNLAIQTNVIDQAWRSGVKHLLFLGSSCIYPRDCPQPIREEYLLSGPLEPTNEAYALAKIAGLKMCEAYNRQYGTRYLAVMPCNLYGPNDNYDLESSHVIPALIRKFHEAKIAKQSAVILWGTGTPRREFLHADDLAAACVLLMQQETVTAPLINIGAGQDLTIRELAELVRDVVGFKGEILLDTSKPDGTPQKLLNISKMKSLGWEPNIGLKAGLKSTYDEFCH